MALSLASGTALCSSALSAQTANERTLAEALFREARGLMASGDFDAACPKFAESQRLDPGGGTLLNLAVCHEKQGRFATAWAEFQEALTQARSDARQDRVVLAEERIQALEPQLAHVTVSVAEPALLGLSVTVNGTPLGAAAWGVPMPVDAGDVRIEASAKHHEPFTKVVSVRDGEELDVEVPALRALEPAADEAEPGAATAARDNTSAYVFGALGVAAVGVGSYFGVRALQEHSRAKDAGCDDNQCTTRAGRRADENAVFSGWLSTVGIGAGLAALGVAVYLYEPEASEQPPGRDRQGLVVLPSASPASARLDLVWVY